MDACPQTSTPLSPTKQSGSDNVWSVDFAISENAGSAKQQAGPTDRIGAATVDHSLPTVKACFCGRPLTGRQLVACSATCRNRMHARAFQRANPFKVRAQERVKAAIRSKRWTRPSRCSACDCACRPDAHHEDYRFWYLVTWLCRKCHVAADRARAARARLSPPPTEYFAEDICAILQISRSTLERRRRARTFPIPELPSLDKRPRWTVAAVETFLAKQHGPTVARRTVVRTRLTGRTTRGNHV